MWRFASFCTQEIDSTPPATSTGTRSTSTRCAAMAIACRPDEQKRFTVDARGGHGQAGAQRDLARDVAAGGALGQRAAHEDVLHFGRVEPRALDRRAHRVRAQGGAVRHVERAAPGLGEAGAGGGDDDGVGHGSLTGD